MLPWRSWRCTFCGTKTSLMQSTRVAKSAPPITVNPANSRKPYSFASPNLRRQSPRRVNLIENMMSNRLQKWSVVTKADVRRSVLPRRSLHAINASRQISADVASLIRTSRMWRNQFIRRLSINLIVRWAQSILIKRSDITTIKRMKQGVASSFVSPICASRIT